MRAAAIEKRYGDVVALRGVDLTVETGEFLTLLGPSGSGKTTLLNVIAGFQTPDHGEVWVDERPVTNLPAHARGFGMVFQSYALFPHMTVAENVGYPLRMRGIGRQERSDLVLEYLRLVELGELAHRYPAQLSGGEQQRVALARALVFKPAVLLMDEPLGALDRRLRQALQFAIKRLHRELQASILYVTHDQEEALAMSDRVVVMHDGLIEQVGSPRAVYEHPLTPFVASFLGETNLLRVEVLGPDAPGSRVRHLDSGQEFCIPDALEPGTATVSLRPENVRVGRRTGDCALHGRAISISFMGDAWRCEISIGDGVIIARQPVHEGMSVGEGDEASIGVLAGGIRLMPSQEEN